jgi:hypothetical protein
MSFGIEDELVQTYLVRVGEDEIEVFQRFSQPEAFHAVVSLHWRFHHVTYCGVAEVCLGVVADCLPHLPSNVLVLRIARDPVHVEYRFYCLRSENLYSH